MEKNCRAFGVTARGEAVESWTLENEFLTAEVLTYGASLRIEYEAESNADTLCSLTNHSYFNLNGGGTAMAHTLTLAAETYLETSPGCLPTGRALPVAETPFDFRAAKPVGRDISAPAERKGRCDVRAPLRRMS